MKKTKLKLFRGLNNDIALRIYAVILAIIIWFVMSVTLYPTVYKTIRNVPVTIDTTGTNAADYMLKPINFSEPKITVNIKGMRYEIGNYSADDLLAKAVVNANVNKAGEYDLDIKVEAKNGADFNVISVNPAKIKVKFDQFIEKEFSVTSVETPNIKAAEGYIKETPECVPNTIKISGPKQEIDRIDKVVVKTNATETLQASQSISDTNIILYSNNVILDNNLFTFDNDKFSIEVPIYMKKSVNLKVALTNIPKRFDLNSLKYSITPEKIDVSAANDLIANLEDLTLDYINMSTIDLNMSKVIPIPEDGFKIISGTKSATVTFDTKGYSSKYLSISKQQIYLINQPAQYDISLLSTGISNIKIIGPKDVIDKLTPADLIAEVDLFSSNISENTSTLPVTISSPKYNNIWAYGEYKVSLDVKNKS